jgi:hypothetical protein
MISDAEIAPIVAAAQKAVDRGFAGPFDFKGHTDESLQLLPGGYIGVWIPGRGWTQRFARGVGDYTDELADQPSRIWPRVGSRRQRRGRRHKRSDPKNHV